MKRLAALRELVPPILALFASVLSLVYVVPSPIISWIGKYEDNVTLLTRYYEDFQHTFRGAYGTITLFLSFLSLIIAVWRATRETANAIVKSSSVKLISSFSTCIFLIVTSFTLHILAFSLPYSLRNLPEEIRENVTLNNIKGLLLSQIILEGLSLGAAALATWGFLEPLLERLEPKSLAAFLFSVILLILAVYYFFPCIFHCILHIDSTLLQAISLIFAPMYCYLITLAVGLFAMVAPGLLRLLRRLLRKVQA